MKKLMKNYFVLGFSFAILLLIAFILLNTSSTSLFESNFQTLSAEKDSFQRLTKDQGISLDEQFKILQRHRAGGYTKLMCALEMKAPIDEIKRLISEGEDVNAYECEFIRAANPVLRYAIERGTDQESVEIIQLLLNKGADIEGETYNRVQDKKTYGMMTIFHYAVIYSSPEVVQMFIDFGADVNHSYPNRSGIVNPRTPLESAKLLHRRAVEQVLLKAGAIEKGSEI